MNAVRTPPVNEVVLSVQFPPQDQLIGPRLPQMLGEWYETHPGITTAPPYEMPAEHESLYAGQPGLGSPRIEIAGPGAESRYWFSSGDEVYVIQVQRSFLALNWRRRTEEYVRFDELRKRFLDVAGTVMKNLEAHGGTLVPNRAELSYINMVQPNDVWAKANDLHKLIDINFWDRDVYEQFALQYSKSLHRNGQWIGRSHVVVQPIYSWLTQEPSLYVNLTARSGLLEIPNFEASIDFLDYAHDSINHTFLSMLRPEATTFWGLTSDS